MKRQTGRCFLLQAGALFAAASGGRADVVFSDLTTPTPTSLTIAGQDGSSTYEIADSFTSS